MKNESVGIAPVNNLRGIAYLLCAGVFLTTNDGIIKWLVPHYPAGQILFIMASLIVMITLVVMHVRGESPLAVRRWRPHIYRGGLYVIGSFAFVFALGFLPFAEVVAIAFVGPMLLTLFGRFFLGESVGWHRLGAVIIGFIGVLFVIRPGTDAMHWAVVLPIIVAIADAARDMVTRQMADGESNFRIVLSTGCMLAVAGLLTAIGGWEPLRSEDLIWFGLSASTFVIAHFLMVEAYRYGQLGAVAPFRYAQLVWTVLAGIIFWGEVPVPAVFIGIVIICASGVYIAWREATQKQR